MNNRRTILKLLATGAPVALTSCTISRENNIISVSIDAEKINSIIISMTSGINQIVYTSNLLNIISSENSENIKKALLNYSVAIGKFTIEISKEKLISVNLISVNSFLNFIKTLINLIQPFSSLLPDNLGLVLTAVSSLLTILQSLLGVTKTTSLSNNSIEYYQKIIATN